MQEALTNVVRHADASGRERPDRRRTTATSSSRSRTTGRAIGLFGGGARDGGGGSGIRGMTERAAALGGQLTAGRGPGRGFAVRARLPLEPR